MFNKKYIKPINDLCDDLCKKLSECLPDSLKDSKEKCCSQFKSILQSSFEKLDLVSKEDFDRQAKHLQELREKLSELEEKLEEKLKEKLKEKFK